MEKEHKLSRTRSSSKDFQKTYFRLAPKRHSVSKVSREEEVRKSRESRKASHLRASRPEIKIIQEDTVEVVEIRSDSNSNSFRTHQVISESDNDSDFESESNLSRTSGFEQVQSMKQKNDNVVFPKPNPEIIRIIELLLAKAQFLFGTITGIAPVGDPLASRLLGFLSSVAFDMDFVLRYSLRLHHPIQTIESLEMNNSPKLLERVAKLGRLGTTLLKMNEAAVRNKVKITPKQLNMLLTRVAYEVTEDMDSVGKYQALSTAFLSLAKSCANYANRLYQGSGVFTVYNERIHLSRVSFDESDDVCTNRIKRANLHTFIKDVNSSWFSVLVIFEKLRLLWTRHGYHSKALYFNDYEMLMLKLAKAEDSTFLSPKIKPFVRLKDHQNITKDGSFSLKRFCRKSDILERGIFSVGKLQKHLEKQAMKECCPDGITLDNHQYQLFLKHQKEANEYEAKLKSKGRTRRKFARKMKLGVQLI